MLGLPVVALSRTGVADFVRPGREGLLADDDAGLARAVARLVVDGGLRSAIRSHNLQVPSGLDWPTALAAHDALYLRARSAAGIGVEVAS